MKKLDYQDYQVIISYCREYYLSIPKMVKYIEPKLDKIDNLSSYLEKIDRTKFVTNKRIHNLQVSLMNVFQKYKFTGSFKDSLMIEEIEVHCLLEFPITCEELETTNEAIAKYCEEKKFDIFKDYLLKSKVIKKCSPPLIYLEKVCGEIAKIVDEYEH